jgi:hypothetical protein
MIKRLFGLTVFAVVLMAVLSATPAFAGEIPTAPALAAPAAGGCGQAVVLPAKGETCSAAQPESVLPGVVEASHRLGYCHCGCVNQRVCRTSADCGGASCDQAISCC